MKTILLGLAFIGILTSCSENASETNKSAKNSSDTTKVIEADQSTELKPADIKPIVSGYLQIKNALTTDNAKDAALGGQALADALTKFDATSFTSTQLKMYNDVKEDIKEHGEHISSNAAKIAHQREHFDMLSKDMYDLVKAVNPNQTLYQDHCPMYNDGKGANWLSEVKEIKNPYLGKKMPECGSVKETISR